MMLIKKNGSKPFFLGVSLCFSAFFFCCSAAFLCYVIFFNTTSGWTYLVYQLLAALAVAMLISSVMVMTAIMTSGNTFTVLKTK
jgi:hypothetical protein